MVKVLSPLKHRIYFDENGKITNPKASGFDKVIFGEEFGGTTDLKIGPDGYLYIVSVGLGKIFKIVPA